MPSRGPIPIAILVLSLSACGHDNHSENPDPPACTSDAACDQNWLVQCQNGKTIRQDCALTPNHLCKTFATTSGHYPAACVEPWQADLVENHCESAMIAKFIPLTADDGHAYAYPILAHSHCHNEYYFYCSGTAMRSMPCRHCRQEGNLALCDDCTSDDSCPPGLICQNGLCVDTPCEDACVKDDKNCLDGGTTLCGYHGNSACLSWSAPTPCSPVESCQNGLCIADPGNGCQDLCQPGQRQCDGSGFRLCGNFDDQPCLEWSDITACQANTACQDGHCQPLPANLPSRYLATHPHSPLTSYAVAQLKNILQNNPTRSDKAFMKIGDSHSTYTSRFMRCFSNANTGASHAVSLDTHGHLQPAIDHFQSSGFDAFERNSLTAVGGMSAAYSFGENRLQNEILATNPRFAFFAHGTNDMGMGGYTKERNGPYEGYAAALETYYRNVLRTVDTLIAAGIIPLTLGIAPRNDNPSTVAYASGAPAIQPSGKPRYYVSTFNAVMRGVAESRQIPFFDLHTILKTLPSEGLSSDNIHANTATSACSFTPTHLPYGANRRNLHSLEMLSRVHHALTLGQTAPDTVLEAYQGQGSPSDPWRITSLPFTHSANTAHSPHSLIHTYDCAPTVSEAGPEYYYQLTLTETKRLRLFVLSAQNADLDLHLKQTATGTECLKRADRWFEAKLTPGTYYLTVDTYSGPQNAGEYLLGILECDEDDIYCAP